MADESTALSAMTGFSINGVLEGLDLPTGGLTDQLGFNLGRAGQLFGDDWAAEAVGRGQGDDWEEEVDRDMMNEEQDLDDQPMYATFDVPGTKTGGKRVKVVRTLVPKKKTIHELFPSYRKDKVLNFTDLFQGHIPRKVASTRRPLQGNYPSSH